MIEILEPLSSLAGVRVVALVTHDGVPVAVPGRDLGSVEEDPDGEEVPFTDAEALSCLSIGFLDEMTRGMGLISGGAPERVVLKAARGTLIMQRAAGAVLVVVMRGGLDPEELRLPMDGAAARIQRTLRSLSVRKEDTSTTPEPPGLFPTMEGHEAPEEAR